MNRPPLVFGLWDGHDAGVCACDAGTGRVLFAANEERFTRRKLDVGFPSLALAAAVAACGRPDEIRVSTTDPAKLLARLLPSTARSYYRHRRHQTAPGPLTPVKRLLKLAATQVPPLAGGAALTRFLVARRAEPFTGRVPVTTVDHHRAHLQAAWFTSGFPDALVLSLDGIGDGCSGAVALGGPDGLREFDRFSGRDSLGLLYEEATRLLSMRELEDEGKVMSLASHADLDDKARRVFSDLVEVRADSGRLRLKVGARPYKRLREILWKWGPERFAAAVQALAEEKVLAIVEAGLALTGAKRLAVAGGVFANVKVNRRIRERFFADADGFRVFPHMGDGGLALGAAVAAPSALDPYLGPGVTAEAAASEARERGLTVREVGLDDVARRLERGDAIGWINGRMELGPRALGARSILARPDDRRIRDKLNLVQKRRVFYQPFCPTLLASEARRSLVGYDGRPERWMTSLYGVAASGESRLAGVMGPDHSCRPQILPESPATPEERLFAEMVEAAARRTGIGGVLNTSFNIHGDPIVATEKDAIDALVHSGLDALVVCGTLEITRS